MISIENEMLTSFVDEQQGNRNCINLFSSECPKLGKVMVLTNRLLFVVIANCSLATKLLFPMITSLYGKCFDNIMIV